MASIGVVPSVAVATKVTGEPERPLTEAVVVCSPGVGPRVRCTDARPSTPVWAVVAETLPAPWGSQLTLTPCTGFPDGSVTSTTRGLARLPPTGPLCPSPLADAMAAAAGGGVVSPLQRGGPAAGGPVMVTRARCRSRGGGGRWGRG